MAKDGKKKIVIPEKKKAVVIFLAAILILGILCGIGYAVIDFVETYNEQGKTDDPASKFTNEATDFEFYEPDYNLDVTTVPEYMERDRLLYYKYGAEEFGIESDFKKYGKSVEFFKEYFDTIIAGDYESYNKMFTDHYYEDNQPYTKFAPQMLYDMHIEMLWQKYEDGADKFAYNVTYKIFQNNGTFRKDIDSDSSRTLYFELVAVDGELKVDRITYYVPGEEE